MKRVFGVVPAKGQSTRLHSKNKLTLNGRPLFLIAAQHLERIIPKSRIFVDTDDSAIARVAREEGFQVLDRPGTLATNATSGVDLMEWELSQLEECDILIQHFPTMPFLREKTLKTCLKAVQDGGFDSAFCLKKTSEYFWSAPDRPSYSLRELPNSVELPNVWKECMGLYVSRAKVFELERSRICGNFTSVEPDVFEMIDINSSEDYALAKAVARDPSVREEYM